MPGRRRTGSRPSHTSMCLAVYPDSAELRGPALPLRRPLPLGGAARPANKSPGALSFFDFSFFLDLSSGGFGDLATVCPIWRHLALRYRVRNGGESISGVPSTMPSGRQNHERQTLIAEPWVH